MVEDTSMQPTVRPGDGILVCQWHAPQPGDVVVLREPDRHLTFAIKRVERLESNGAVVVQADNPNVSRDSRDYGPVPKQLILGRVFFRYLPAERRGRL
ncbi:MAG: S26 family signal peptidase [Chloroflexi bacterium]|nr:S26 family signal peptidase [Chloroflexota bacterium]